MGASRAALLGGWLHVCWAATRLSELAPSPEDAAPNSIALPAAGGSMADDKTTGRARMDVGEVAPLRRAAAMHSGALQPRAAATRAYLGLARTYVPRNRASNWSRYRRNSRTCDPRAATKAASAAEGGGASREAAATQFESGGGDRREDLGTTPGSPTPVAWIRMMEG